MTEPTTEPARVQVYTRILAADRARAEALQARHGLKIGDVIAMAIHHGLDYIETWGPEADQ